MTPGRVGIGTSRPNGTLPLHVVVALVRGTLSPGAPDRLAELLFERAAADDLAHAYWVLYRDFSDAKGPSAATAVERLVKLWEWRLAELKKATDRPRAAEEASGLGWLFMVAALPDDRVLELLVRTARVADGAFQMGHSLWERLGKVAARDPASVLDVASRLIDAELKSEHPHFNREEVGQVLQAALSAGDGATKRTAERLVNKLGEHGFTEFGDLRSQERPTLDLSAAPRGPPPASGYPANPKGRHAQLPRRPAERSG